MADKYATSTPTYADRMGFIQSIKSCRDIRAIDALNKIFASKSSNQPHVLNRHYNNNSYCYNCRISAINDNDNPHNMVSSQNDNQTTFEPQQYQFKAEIGKVLDIIINSLYTDRDIFIRELVSNAADACQKKNILQNTKDTDNGTIWIQPNKNSRTLTITDNGVGMTRQELVDNLGTVAESGTSKFLTELAHGSVDQNLIGQFGVGFYSAFLVASQVDVLSKSYKSPNENPWKWSSNSPGGYSVQGTELPSDAHFQQSGTCITLHLKPDADEYLEDYKLKELLRKYSEFVPFPIKLLSEKVTYERVGEGGVGIGDRGKLKTVSKRSHEWMVINEQGALWRRDPNSVSIGEYRDFYKSTFKAYDDPVGYIHFKIEGEIDFNGLLYVPGAIPWELSQKMFETTNRGIRLYVRSIFINDKFGESMPRWLSFIRGVVDSEELPLNVGREILQKSRLLRLMTSRLSSKCLEMFQKIRSDGGDSWRRMWNNFGRYLKIGVVEDTENSQSIASLLQFHSSKSPEKERSLDEYLSDKKPGQTAIYYLGCENVKVGLSSPILEKFRGLDVEVLFALDAVDEFCLSSLGMHKYNGVDVIDASQKDLNLDKIKQPDGDNKAKISELDTASLCDWLRRHYGDKVSDVCITDKLVESPAALVRNDFGMSPAMQKYIQQQGGDTAMNSTNGCLEINMNHSLIRLMSKKLLSGDTGRMGDLADELLDIAQLQAGYGIKDISSFSRRTFSFMLENDTSLEQK